MNRFTHLKISLHPTSIVLVIVVCSVFSLLLFLRDKEAKCALLTTKVDGSKMASFLNETLYLSVCGLVEIKEPTS